MYEIELSFNLLLKRYQQNENRLQLKSLFYNGIYFSICFHAWSRSWKEINNSILYCLDNVWQQSAIHTSLFIS